MFKKIVSIVLIISCLSSLNGCTGVLRRKFVRKKKYEKKPTPVFQPQLYEDEFTISQRYANHFTFWKNAESEVISLLTQNKINNKKLRTYASYALDEINHMHKLLINEKKQQIAPYAEELSVLVEKMMNSSYVSAHKHTLTKKLKHHYREVARRFSYSMMKGHLQK